MSRAIFEHNMSTRHVVRVGSDYIQLVASHDGLALDVTAKPFDTYGRRRIEHAATRLTIHDAEELRDALEEAIAAANTIDHPAQPAFWSDATVASVAARMPRRVRGGAAV